MNSSTPITKFLLNTHFHSNVSLLKEYLQPDTQFAHYSFPISLFSKQISLTDGQDIAEVISLEIGRQCGANPAFNRWRVDNQHKVVCTLCDAHFEYQIIATKQSQKYIAFKNIKNEHTHIVKKQKGFTRLCQDQSSNLTEYLKNLEYSFQFESYNESLHNIVAVSSLGKYYYYKFGDCMYIKVFNNDKETDIFNNEKDNLHKSNYRIVLFYGIDNYYQQRIFGYMIIKFSDKHSVKSKIYQFLGFVGFSKHTQCICITYNQRLEEALAEIRHQLQDSFLIRYEPYHYHNILSLAPKYKQFIQKHSDFPKLLLKMFKDKEEAIYCGYNFSNVIKQIAYAEFHTPNLINRQPYPLKCLFLDQRLQSIYYRVANRIFVNFVQNYLHSDFWLIQSDSYSSIDLMNLKEKYVYTINNQKCQCAEFEKKGVACPHLIHVWRFASRYLQRSYQELIMDRWMEESNIKIDQS